MELKEEDRENRSVNWKIVYPEAVIPDDVATMRTKGEYSHGFAKGATVHFTAGWNNKTAESSMHTGLKNGYCYLTILADGTVVQNFDLARWGYHAGSSKWDGLGSGLSSKLIGIEVCCGGRLHKVGDEWKTWFNKTVPADKRRWVEKGDNILRDGMYEMYTEAQEKALEKFLLWCAHKGKGVFELDYVLGHDEIAPSRKNDPGGSLSMTMPKFRDYLKSKYDPTYQIPVEEVVVDEPLHDPESPDNFPTWNPLIYFNKMDNFFQDPTQSRYDDLKRIVWPSARKKILELTKVKR